MTSDRACRVERELTAAKFGRTLSELYVDLETCQRRQRVRLLARRDIDMFLDVLSLMVSVCASVGLPHTTIYSEQDSGGVAPSGGKRWSTRIHASFGRLRVTRTRARLTSKDDDGQFRIGVRVDDLDFMKQLHAVGWKRDGALWCPKEVYECLHSVKKSARA